METIKSMGMFKAKIAMPGLDSLAVFLKDIPLEPMLFVLVLSSFILIP